MQYNIREITEPIIKSQICNDILRELPEWFANEESIVDYTHKSENLIFYAAFDNERAVGFAAIKEHNIYTAEVCVMGILHEYHRHGIGRLLIKMCEDYCLATQKVFLTVKTLDSSVNYEPYDSTRNFYNKMGFIPLEVFPLHWDIDNPCLFLAKYIGVATLSR